MFFLSKNLKAIIHRNITSEKKINVFVYYKQRKLSSVFAEDRAQPVNHVVYNFQCNTCSRVTNSQYIGYTACTLATRCNRHHYSGAIKSHFQEAHDTNISGNEIVDQTQCRFKSPYERELRIAEAIIIQMERPKLNTRDEFRTHTLKVFLCVNRPIT